MPLPKIVITLGLMAVQMAMGALRTIEGPRLKDTQVSTADPGTPFPNGLGLVRTTAVVIHAEPLKEKKKKRKGKGGKYKEWLYFNTASWVFAGHPAQRVRRIWFEKHLVYDATGESVVSLGDSSDTVEDLDGNNTNFADLTDIYLGAEDQEPDPRMLAYIEAREGEGTCPAYRGLSRLDAKDFPLDKLGNKPPSIVEVEYEGIGGEATLDSERVSSAIDAQQWVISPNGRYGLRKSATDWVMIDLDTLAVTQETSSVLFTNGVIDDDGTIYFHDAEDFKSVGGFGAGAVTDIATLPFIPTFKKIFALPNGDHVVAMASSGNPESDDVVLWNITTATLTTLTNTNGFWAAYFYQDMHGDVWAAGTINNPVSPNTELHFWRIVDAGSGTAAPDHNVAVLAPGWDVAPTMEIADTPSGILLIWDRGQKFFLLDDVAYTTTLYEEYSTSAVTNLSYIAVRFGEDFRPGLTEFWYYASGENADTDRLQVSRITVADLTTVETRDLGDWGIGDDVGYIQYLTAEQALISIDKQASEPEANDVILRYFTTSGGDLTLGTAIRYFSGLVGLTETSDYTIDSAADSIPVTGYAWTQGTAKQSLELLLDLYDCECRIHDGLPQFIARGSAVAATIETPDFVVERESPGSRYKLTVANDTDLPRRAVLTYASTEADLQPATVKAERRLDSFDGVGELTIDGTTVTLEPDIAQQLVDRYFRRRHFCRISGELRLSARHLTVEGGDLIDLDFDGTTITCHIDKITDSADGSRHLAVSNDDPAIAGMGAGVGGVSLGRPDSEIFTPGASTGELLDVPMLTDAHDQAAPFLYLGGGPVDAEASYVGTEFHQSDTGDDATYVAGWDGTGSSDPMTFGEVAVPPAADPLPWLWDSGTVLEVALANGLLSNATEEQVLSDGTVNLFAYGAPGRWLLGQFRTATLTAPLNYDVSNILWGVRGTEHLIGTSEADDRFVLLDSAIIRHTMGAGEIGDEDWYIAAAPGATPNPANEFSLQFEANAHRPYAPVHGALTFDTGVTDDITIDAVRRTRIGGAALNGQNVPLGEASEVWQADVYDGATFKRTITGTALPLTYTAAQQITDFGAPITTGFEINLYQMNPTLNLRGTPLQLAA